MCTIGLSLLPHATSVSVCFTSVVSAVYNCNARQYLGPNIFDDGSPTRMLRQRAEDLLVVSFACIRAFLVIRELIAERLGLRSNDTGRTVVHTHQRPSTSLLQRSCETNVLVLIWLFEGLNFLVHVILRPRPWSVASTAVGYALWALQLTCFARCQLTLPGAPPDAWVTRAEAGTVSDARRCKRSGAWLPPRSRHVRRVGGVVLGFDHYCHWLGTPIGLYNRKFFVLFVIYSAVFCAVGAAHTLHEVAWGLPAWLELTAGGRGAAKPAEIIAESWPLAWLAQQAAYALASLAPSSMAALWRRACAHELGLYTSLLFLAAILNLLAATALGCLAVQQALLACFNRVTLAPADATWDMDVYANLRELFGPRMALWWLPVGGPAGDGLTWPRADGPSVRANEDDDGDEEAQEAAMMAELDEIVPTAGPARTALRWILLWEEWFLCGTACVGLARLCVRRLALMRRLRGREVSGLRRD